MVRTLVRETAPSANRVTALPDPLSDPPAFLRGLLNRAVAAVQPATCVAAALPPPPRAGRTIVLGAGKAAAAMAAAVEDAWPHPLEGLVVTRDGYACPTERIGVVEASHPVPDARGLAACERILAMAAAATADDLVLFLISGGASSLLVAPAAGITLAEKRGITTTLLKSGAMIEEINCVRKHLSRVKGGRLAQAAAPARCVTLIISDVVGDDPTVIASGPTVADPTTCQDALAVLARYEVALSDAASEGLNSGRFETPKRLDNAGRVQIVARPGDALAAVAAAARAAGVEVIDLGDGIEGEARAVAADHAARAQAFRATTTPALLLSGGELTVTVRGNGRGGPNTEYALALLDALGEDNRQVHVLAADTDGTDGNAGVAGACFGPSTWAKAAAHGLSPATYLAASDSATFFERVGGLVDTGPTLTNVNDLRLVLVLPDSGGGPIGRMP
jgi:hydroxypyruvate reductase